MALFSSMVFGPILAFSAKTVSANLRPHAIRKFPSKTAAFSSFFRQSSFESSIRGHHSNKMKSALFGSVAGEGKGTSIRDSLKEVSESGEFKRKESAWRNWISKEDGAQFPPEAGRYHLYVAYACPWAHRTLMVRALKGLEDAISVTVVHPIWRKTKSDADDHRGWVFGSPDGGTFKNTEGLGGPFPMMFPGNEPEPTFGSNSIRGLYERSGDTDGKYTVPILWDKHTNTIVSNESSEIIRMLNSEFDAFAKSSLDLYPEGKRVAIDEANEWIYPNINNGVYRCGFATSQSAYDNAIDELTTSFDRVDKILQNQRFIASDDKVTEADIRLFATLLRFDEVYTVYFKTNSRSVATTPSILNYCREIFALPVVAETCNMEQIKAHYYCSHTELNKWSIIPRGAEFMKLLKQPITDHESD